MIFEMYQNQQNKYSIDFAFYQYSLGKKPFGQEITWVKVFGQKNIWVEKFLLKKIK